MKREKLGGELMKLSGYEAYLVDVAEEICFYLIKSGAKAEDAKDIAQDILVKILASDIVLPADRMRAWLYRTAIRTYIDKYRRDKRYHEILQKAFFTEETWIKFDDKTYEPLSQCLLSLDQKYRLPLDLFYFQDLTVREIAELLHYSVSKVKINLMRGRKALRQKLEKEGYTYEDFI